MTTIAHRLKAVRKAQGVAMRPFAAAVRDAGYEVSYGAVAGYEAGDGGPEKIPAEYLAAVSRAFGVSAGWLLHGTGQMHEPPQDEKAERYDKILAVIQGEEAPTEAPADVPYRELAHQAGGRAVRRAEEAAAEREAREKAKKRRAR